VNRPIDLDRYLNRYRLGLLPLPPSIARRLDSDNDEIAAILAEGGTIFYCEPRPLEVGFDQRGIGLWDWDHTTAGSGDTSEYDRSLAVEAQSLIFAVRGYPQQNAIPTHHVLNWPYYDKFPSPPTEYEYQTFLAQAAVDPGKWRGTGEFTALWTFLDDPEVRPSITLRYPGNAPGYNWRVNGSTMTGAEILTQRNVNTLRVDEYIRLAKELVEAQGFTVDTTGTMRMPAPLPQPGTPLDRNNPDHFPPAAWITALKALAHAAAYRTSSMANPLADANQKTFAQNVYEACIAWTMRYASSDPYDWGASRPLNRTLCTDFPLLQYDLALPKLAASGDASWATIAPYQPQNYGESLHWKSTNPWWPGRSLSTKALITNNWGNARNLNLTARFEAAERCRTLLCWSVDWKSYADAESAPSAPIEATRCFLDSDGNEVALEGVSLPPERDYLWKDDAHSAVYTWSRAYDWTYNDPTYKQRYLGIWGADRNGNGSFDVGPVPTSTRLRATPVSRINFYDRRIASSFK
jgi:hypothetical protein